MKWHVEGADAHTGQEKSGTIEAPTAADAEQLARDRGVLVSNVQPANEPDALEQLGTAAARQPRSIDYRSPRASAAAITSDIPTYQAILRGDVWLRALAAIIAGFGWVSVGLAGLLLLLTLPAAASGASLSGIVAFALSIGPALLAGLLLLAVSAILRWAASVGLAIRDLARNSFRD
jgi:hypothetical protein